MANIFRWYCALHGDACDRDPKRRHIFRLITK